MDNFAEMTLEEFLFEEVDPYVLDDLADRKTYWADVQRFVDTNIQRRLKTMTEKQRNWVLRIKQDLESEQHGR